MYILHRDRNKITDSLPVKGVSSTKLVAVVNVVIVFTA